MDTRFFPLVRGIVPIFRIISRQEDKTSPVVGVRGIWNFVPTNRALLRHLPTEFLFLVSLLSRRWTERSKKKKKSTPSRLFPT